MVRRLPFQNNHGGGIVTGMGEREVQLFYAEGVGLFPSLSGQNEFGLAGTLPRERSKSVACT